MLTSGMTGTTKHTSQISVRVLGDTEERDVHKDLEELLTSNKVGPSKRRLAFTFFDASPQFPSGEFIGSMWSTPNSQHVSPHALHHPSHPTSVGVNRRSKDDSVIFATFGAATRDALASVMEASERTPARNGSPPSGGAHATTTGNQSSCGTEHRNNGVRHLLDSVAIEASGATPYGCRSSWTALPNYWSGVDKDKVRSPSSPNKNRRESNGDENEPECSNCNTRRLTLKELLLQVPLLPSERPTPDMKHVSSGPL
jgi:hypothetical protein